MKTLLFRGSGVAIATPFHQDDVDFTALDALVDFQIENGTAAIIACGTTGEPSTMSEGEKESVIARVAERVNGRVPVIAGTGCNDTRKTILAARRAKALGADAQLCVTPYYNKTSPHGLIAHYTAIADDNSLPVVIYNVPARTALNMRPDTLAALAKHPNIAAMKEASGDLSQMLEMVRLCGEDIAFYSGSDDNVAPLLSLGFEGVISVASNVVPRLMSDLTAAFFAGDWRESLRLQLKVNPLVAALFCEVSPVPVKAALQMMGLCEETVRLPLVPMLKENKARLEREMKALNLIQ
jgi:4-hydroxy-tetrahydrodipicolinate synthase